MSPPRPAPPDRAGGVPAGGVPAGGMGAGGMGAGGGPADGMGADGVPAVGGGLPGWRHVLAVVAHPDDESFGLGGLLAAFADAGAHVGVLCLTAGEASTLHGVPGALREVRARELAEAATALGVAATTLLHHPDGGLAALCRTRLVADVLAAAADGPAEGMVVFDPSGVTGHPDHAAATAAALGAATLLGLPVLGWTLPEAVAGRLSAEHGVPFHGHPAEAIDIVTAVDRARQRAAAAAHASQAVPTSVLWHRLALLGPVEHLRWLRRGDAAHHDDGRERTWAS